MTSTSGRSPLIADAVPPINPPPPTGITTRARSGISSTSSSPSPPWPAITSVSAKEWMNASVSVFQPSFASQSRSFGLGRNVGTTPHRLKTSVFLPGRVPRCSSPVRVCPDCGKPALRRLVSTFATARSGDDGGDDFGGDDMGGAGDDFDGGEGGFDGGGDDDDY